jgi:hypothetical protein
MRHELSRYSVVNRFWSRGGMILKLRLGDPHHRLQYLSGPGGRVAEIYHASCLGGSSRVLLLLLEFLLLFEFRGGKFLSAVDAQVHTILARCSEIRAVLTLPRQRPFRGIVP